MTELGAVRDEDWELSHLYGLFEEIDMCGCGWPGDAYTLVRDLLDHFHNRDDRDVVEMIGSTGAAQLVLRRLDRAGLIDHGTRVTSSWMTDKGRYARHLMHKHPTYGCLDLTGYPDCFDHDLGCCPGECWTPTADVPPEPPRPTMEELMATVKQEADEALAQLDPLARSMYEEIAARMDSQMLFGTPEPPDVVPEPGALARGAGIDLEAEAAGLRKRIDAARRAGTVDLLSRIAGPTPAPESLVDQHMKNMTIYGTASPAVTCRPSGYINEWGGGRVSFWPQLERNWCAAVEGVLNAAGPSAPENWAAAYDPESLRRLLPTTPTDPTEGDAMSDQDAETQTADGETAEVPTKPAGCYQHESGTFIHVAGHPNCPSYLQGAKRNVRRMRP
jgi:hypothetical protein